MKSLRIIFMGTPEFAVPSLQKLLQANYHIVGVITAPDKPAGRGMHTTKSAVKKYALEKGLKILQPKNLKAPEFIEELKLLRADLQVIVAFRMLPEVVWNMPPLGSINLHASLLPNYRGAAPINWAIINGEKETGVTTFKLQHQVDTGNILLQQKISIGEDETAGELHDRLKEIGADLLLQTVNGLAEGLLEEMPQEQLSTINYPFSTGFTDAPRIYTETCKIDWNQPVDNVYNLIRGLAPYPAAFTFLHNKTCKIFKAKKEKQNHSVSPGEFETDTKSYLKFACSNGYIALLELQLEGKKRMKVEEFLRGFRF